MTGPVPIAAPLHLDIWRQGATGAWISVPIGTYLIICTPKVGRCDLYLGSFTTSNETLLVFTKSKRLVFKVNKKVLILHECKLLSYVGPTEFETYHVHVSSGRMAPESKCINSKRSQMTSLYLNKTFYDNLISSFRVQNNNKDWLTEERLREKDQQTDLLSNPKEFTSASPC